jgi:hypothetical protein
MDETSLCNIEVTERASRSPDHQLYGVIYATPPWASMNEPQLERLCTMKVPAADDCILYLYTGGGA